jgi:hypothetical protein
MARHGYVESALHARFPEGRITVRSWAREGFRLDRDGDEAGKWLARFGPDLILASVGRNESFDGPQGVAGFARAVREISREWTRSRSLLKRGPRLLWVVPVPEVPHSPGQPDETVAEARLSPYREALRVAAGEVAAADWRDVGPAFVDLVSEAGGNTGADGARLNRRGHWLLGMWLSRELGWTGGGEGAGPEDPAMAERLREIIRDREQVWEREGRRAEEAMRGWDEAIWRAPKPSVGSVWAEEPSPGEPAPRVPGRLGMPLPAAFGLPGALDAAAAAGRMRAGTGLEITLWASEDTAELWNPVGLRFDGRGRAWIGCAPPGSDPVLLRLTDGDGDHVAERQEILFRGPFHPEGVLPAPGGAYLSVEEGLAWLEEPGPGRGASLELVLGGRVRRGGMRWDQGGGLWFRETAGSPEEVETPWGPVAGGAGGWYRWNPRIGRRERMFPVGDDAEGSREELWFDGWGGFRTPGRDGTLLEAVDRIAAWTGEEGKIGRDGDGGVAGPVAWIDGPWWPKAYRGRVVRAERRSGGGWTVAVYRPERDGATVHWVREEGAFLVAEDSLARPVAMENGPDGSLYLLDAYGQESQLREGHWGRVWRVAPARRPPAWQEPGELLGTEELVGRLGTGAAGVREALWRRPPEEVFPALERKLRALEADDPERQEVLEEALRLHQAFGVRNPELAGRLTESPSPRTRRAAAEALGEWGLAEARDEEGLRRLVEDEDPRVRLAALAACRRIGTEAAGRIAALAGGHPQDAVLREVTGPTVARLGGASGSGAGKRAEAAGTATAELAARELTPQAAVVLLERSGVEPAVLRRAAEVLARRSGQRMEEWMVDRLADRASSAALVANLVTLQSAGDGWVWFRDGERLHRIAESTDRADVRRAAYGALTVGAAGSSMVESLATRVEAGGDFQFVEWLTAAEAVASHPAVKAKLYPVLRNELAAEARAGAPRGSRVRLVAPGWEVLHFAELEVYSGDRQVALGRPAAQSDSGNGRRWWSALAKNGTNGITRWEEEFPLKGLEPGSEPVRGVMVGGRGDGAFEPSWETELGPETVVDRLVYHPGAALPWPRRLRFEILDGTGKPVWSQERVTGHAGPVEVVLDLAEPRRAAAAAAARRCGEEFRAYLERLARGAPLLPARFSAWRALRVLGGPMPDGLRLRAEEVVVRAGGLDREGFRWTAGEAVEVTARNETSQDVQLVLRPDPVPADGEPWRLLGVVARGSQGRVAFSVPAAGRYEFRAEDEDGETEGRAWVEVAGPAAP